MKRALVLAGGGSKGAYEMGFVKALNELHIDYDIVTGTSIGALNGCLIAQQDIEAMQHLWDHLDITKVFEEGFYPDFTLDLDNILNQSHLALTFFKSYLKEKGANITPLKKMIRGLLNEEKLLNSPIDFGLCTVYYPSLKPLFITKKEMEKEYIFDYLIASASCFPAFPIHSFLDKSFIDGGYYDNVPIDLAFSMGADEVIVVDMHMLPTHSYYVNRPHVIYTTPYVDLGSFMDFSKETLQRNQRIGYQTAMKYFHRYQGVVYTFKKFKTPLIEEFYKELLYLERTVRFLTSNETSSNIHQKYLESCKNSSLTVEDYFFITLDWLGELSSKDVSYVYHYDVFTHDLLIDYQEYMDSSYQTVSLRSADEFVRSFQNLSKKTIVGILLHSLLYPEKSKIDLPLIFKLFSKEYMMAKLLMMLYYEKNF